MQNGRRKPVQISQNDPQHIDNIKVRRQRSEKEALLESNQSSKDASSIFSKTERQFAIVYFPAMGVLFDIKGKGQTPILVRWLMLGPLSFVIGNYVEKTRG